jgi:hypothetical protein
MMIFLLSSFLGYIFLDTGLIDNFTNALSSEVVNRRVSIQIIGFAVQVCVNETVTRLFILFFKLVVWGFDLADGPIYDLWLCT